MPWRAPAEGKPPLRTQPPCPSVPSTEAVAAPICGVATKLPRLRSGWSGAGGSSHENIAGGSGDAAFGKRLMQRRLLHDAATRQVQQDRLGRIRSSLRPSIRFAVSGSRECAGQQIDLEQHSVQAGVSFRPDLLEGAVRGKGVESQQRRAKGASERACRAPRLHCPSDHADRPAGSSKPCGGDPLKLPSRSSRSSRLIRRATTSAMPTASSATALAFAPGVLITAIPRARAASRSMLSTPTPCLPTTFSLCAACSRSAVILEVRTMMPSASSGHLSFQSRPAPPRRNSAARWRWRWGLSVQGHRRGGVPPFPGHIPNYSSGLVIRQATGMVNTASIASHN